MSSSSPTKKRKVPSFSPTVKPHTPKKRHSTAVTEPLSGGLPPAKGISQSPTTSGVKVKQEPALVASVSLDLPKNTPGTSTERPILISDDEISSDDADRSDMEDLYADPDPTRSDSVGSESTGEEGDSEGDAEEQLEERTSKSPSPLVKAEGVAASPPSPSTTHALPSRPILTLQEVMDRPSANQLLESTTSSKTLPSVSPAEPDSCPPGAPSAPAAILSPSPPKPRKRQLEVDSPMIDLKKRRLSAGGEPRHLSQAPRKSPSHIFKAPPHKIASLPSQPPASTSLPPPTQISEESPQLSSSLGRTSSTVLVERMLISDVSYTQKSEKVASISPAVSTTPGPAKDPSPSPASSPSQDSTRSRTSSPSPVPSFVKPPPPSQLPPSLSPTTKKRRMRLQRHPEHWHLDGSVIVKIRSTMFRLHRSRLVQQSPYFDKLFDGEEHGSQRDGEGDEDEVIKKRIYIEHTPVFDVPGVSVTDFEHLLEALDGGMLVLPSHIIPCTLT